MNAQSPLPFRIIAILLIAFVLLFSLASPAAAQSPDPGPADPSAPVATIGPAETAEAPTPFVWELLQTVLFVAIPMIASYGIRALMETWVTYRANQPDKADEIRRAAYIAIKAAEQMGLSQYITNKKQYAIEFAQNWLNANGIKVNVGLIEGAIEAAVYEEFNRYKEPTPEDGSDTGDSVSTETVTPPAEPVVFPG